MLALSNKFIRSFLNKNIFFQGLNCLNEKEGFLFGNFTYDINRETLQTYSVQVW